MPNVLVVIGDGAGDVIKLFQSEGWTITKDIEEADLVQFVGGADVSPSLYGQRKHTTTSIDANRDEREALIYAMALERGIPMAGICRGGQFLNVMNGGRLHQDVDGHDRGDHKAYLMGAVLPIIVTSSHHQMMALNWEAKPNILLTAAISTYRKYMSDLTAPTSYEIITHPGNNDRNRNDIEACFYPGTKCLCFQPHPEYRGGSDTKEIYFKFLEQWCMEKDRIPF